MTSMKREEIEHLANLSRIELTDEEIEKYTKQFGEIVSYVDKIKEITGGSEDMKIESAGVSNVFRKDDNVQETGLFTDKILESAPDTKDNFVKVKKILKND